LNYADTFFFSLGQGPIIKLQGVRSNSLNNSKKDINQDINDYDSRQNVNPNIRNGSIDSSMSQKKKVTFQINDRNLNSSAAKRLGSTGPASNS
jgi:hypothetical protein